MSKRAQKTNADVGDRTNDVVRINANELRCKVVAEGGNLGFTQRARIEYSLNGGRINTDFIDNSAGVDSSDREVNIKILLSAAEQEGRLDRQERDQLLTQMAAEVEDLVLRDNYLQTQAISMMEARAQERLAEMGRLISNLEKTGLLNRELENLPDDLEIVERRERTQGLTRPELSVILSYAKIALYNDLERSDESLDDFFAIDPHQYFPDLLHNRFGDLVPLHRLSRQILATVIANNIVNRMGPTFVNRVQIDTGAKIETVARAYIVAREVCQANDIWQMIEELDNKIPAPVQHSMLFEVGRTLRHTCSWIIGQYGDGLDIAKTVEHLGKPLVSLYSKASSIVIGSARSRLKNSISGYIKQGVPEKLAKRMASLSLTRGNLDIADLATEYRREVFATGRMYTEISDRFCIVWMNQNLENLLVEGRWQALARSNLRDELYRIRRDFSVALLHGRSRKKPTDIFQGWLTKNSSAVRKFDAILAEMQLRDDIDFATLSVAAQELRKLTGN